MSKIKTFFRTFIRSITSFSYYQDVIKSPFSFSYKYFFFFCFVVVTTATSILGVFIAREVPPFLARVEHYGRNLFPADLLIEIKNGKLRINRPEPFVIPVPVELLVDQPVAISDQKQLRAFVYDQKAEVTTFDEYNSMIVANNQVLMIKDQNSGIRVLPIKDFQNVTIDKPMIDAGLDSFAVYTRYAVPFLIALIFVGLAAFLVLEKLSSVFMLSVIVSLLARILVGLKLPFKKYYQIGLHTLTLPTLVEIGMLIMGIEVPFAFFYATFFILYTLIICAHLKKETDLGITPGR